MLEKYYTWERVRVTGTRVLTGLETRANAARKYMRLPLQYENPEMTCSDHELGSLLSDAAEAAEQHKLSREKDQALRKKTLMLLKKGSWEKAANLVEERLADTSSFEPLGVEIHPYAAQLQELYLDILIAEGATKKALQWLRTRDGHFRRWMLNKCLNVKLLTGMDIDPEEAFLLWGGSLEKTGRALSEYLCERNNLIEERLSDARKRLRTHSLLDYATRRSRESGMACSTSWELQLFGFFSDSWKRRALVLKRTWLEPHLECYYEFDKMDTCWSEFRRLGEEVIGGLENELRRRVGLPTVGEGWLGQAEMLVALREAFGERDVIAEGSPPWLGRFRFDAWIPSRKLAVEYQGQQHYHSIEHFGGEEKLRETQERDRVKSDLARANGVAIEYIRYDEDTRSRVREIYQRYRQTD